LQSCGAFIGFQASPVVLLWLLLGLPCLHRDYPSHRAGFDAVSPSVRGRIRNELPRKIGSVELKLSFYNSKRELIEVKRVNVFSFLTPGEPTSFKEFVGVWNLPTGWTWALEVSDVHYE